MFIAKYSIVILFCYAEYQDAAVPCLFFSVPVY